MLASVVNFVAERSWRPGAHGGYCTGGTPGMSPPRLPSIPWQPLPRAA